MASSQSFGLYKDSEHLVTENTCDVSQLLTVEVEFSKIKSRNDIFRFTRFFSEPSKTAQSS